MKKPSTNTNRKAARKGGSFRLIAIVAASALIAIAAVTVVSRQRARQQATSDVTNANARNFVTVKVGGQDIHLNGQTDVKPLTQEEIQKMVTAMKKMANPSTEGLSQVQHEDGSVSMDLRDRFQNVTIARQNKDGSVTTSCVDNPTSAARFFAAADDSSDNPTNVDRIQPVRRADQ